MGTTLQEQLDRLDEAREADADPGFPGGMVVLCSLHWTGQGKRSHFVRANCPFTLAMIAVGTARLPCGNLSRLLLAWVCTGAVRTGRRVLVLGNEFRDFMARLGIYATEGYVGCGYETRWSDYLAPPYRFTTGETANPFAWPQPNDSTELWRLILRPTPPQILDERWSGVYA